jgi:hypothetical protein
MRTIDDEHIAQILGYLKSSRKEHGLLINFGSPRYQIKKFIWNDRYCPSLGGKIGSFLLSLSVFSTFFRGH